MYVVYLSVLHSQLHRVCRLSKCVAQSTSSCSSEFLLDWFFRLVKMIAFICKFLFGVYVTLYAHRSGVTLADVVWAYFRGYTGMYMRICVDTGMWICVDTGMYICGCVWIRGFINADVCGSGDLYMPFFS